MIGGTLRKVRVRPVDYLAMPERPYRERDVIDVRKVRLVTVARIRQVVAAHYGLTETDLLSDRRMRSISRPRQLAMYLARHMTTQSLPAIGQMLGKRDHSTVLHAVRRVEQRLTDPAYAEEVALIKRRLRAVE